MLDIAFFSCLALRDGNQWQKFEGSMTISFAPFHGFSSVLKSLRVRVSSTFQYSQISNFIYSFPLLEDVFVQTMFRSSNDSGDPASMNRQPLPNRRAHPSLLGPWNFVSTSGWNLLLRVSRVVSVSGSCVWCVVAKQTFWPPRRWRRDDGFSTLEFLNIDDEFLSTSALYLLWHH